MQLNTNQVVILRNRKSLDKNPFVGLGVNHPHTGDVAAVFILEDNLSDNFFLGRNLDMIELLIPLEEDFSLNKLM